MFIKIQSETINLSKVKKFWSTYRGDVKEGATGVLVFEYHTQDRDTIVFDTLQEAQDMEHNIHGFLDRKFQDFNPIKI